MLSPEVAQRLQIAQDNESHYQPSASIRARLGRRVLIELVAPAAAGKSFVMNRIVERDGDFARAPTFTTREQRPDDEPDMFRYLPHDDESVEDILYQIQAGSLVEYVVHPTTGRIYGTTIDDYPATFNLLPTLYKTAAHLRTLPFRQVHTIGLAVESSTWQKWFAARYPERNAERSKRLGEASLSLMWLLDEQQQYVQWVDNHPERPGQAEQSIINIARGYGTGSKHGPHIARELLATVNEMLQRNF